MILCQVEGCENIAAWVKFRGPSLCHKHHRVCNCDLNRDNPLCEVHGDPRDTNLEPLVFKGEEHA